MFCSNCGNKNPDGVAFCRGCGMLLKPISSLTEPNDNTSNNESLIQEQDVNSEVLYEPAQPRAEKTPDATEVETATVTVPVAEVSASIKATPAVAPEPDSVPVVETPTAAQPALETPNDQPLIQTDSLNLTEPVLATESDTEFEIIEGGSQKQESSTTLSETNNSSEQAQGHLSFSSHLKNILMAAIHPVTGPSDIVSQYNKIGNSLFLVGISVVFVSAIAITTSLLIDLIFMFSYTDEYEGLIGELIARDFLFPFITYTIRTFGCAGLLFLAGLIIKEKWSFSRLLAISSLAVVPAFAVYELLVGILYNFTIYYIGTAVSTACQIYYFIMLYEGMANETKLAKNKKAFVLFTVFTIVAFISSFFSNY